MRNLQLWNIRDPENLGPPVDYHEVRGHLRCGTVLITDDTLAGKIQRSEAVSAEEDVAIRQAVAEAIVRIGRSTGPTPSRLHYLFWNIFRACCRESTHCESCPTACRLPERYAALTAGNRRCLFSAVCASSGMPAKPIEHFAQTDFY